MKEKLQKFKVILIGTISILILLFFLIGYLLFFSKQKINTYQNENYRLNYDSTWKIKEKKKEYLLLKHKKAKVEILMKSLEENNRYNSISTFINDFKNMIQKENKTYQLISQKQETVTKRELEGYKLLYEDKDRQSYVVLSKYNDKLFAIIYECSSDEFDLLLDSVDTIIASFEIKDDAVSIDKKLKEIKTTGISYSTKKRFLSKEQKEHTIKAQEYVVSYKASKDLFDRWMNSTSNFYIFKDEKRNKEMNATSSIRGINIYEYIEEVNKDYERYKKDKEYHDVKLEIEKVKQKELEGFIYKISYYRDYENFITNKKEKKYKEHFYICYVLDVVRTLVFEIDADHEVISEEDLKSFEIIKSQKLGSTMRRTIEDGFVVNTMQTIYKDSLYSKPKYIEITLKTPTQYYETSYSTQNMYEHRKFGLNYDKKLEEYQYDINYHITSFTKEKQIEQIKKDMQNYENVKFSFVKEIEKNKIKYQYYKASYQLKKSKVKYTKAYIVTSLEDGQTLYLEISTKDDIIKESMIEGLLNIKTETKEYKN